MGNAKIIPRNLVTVGGVSFLPYQSKWWQDRSRIKLCEKGRQLGFSWASAYDIDREQGLDSTSLDAWISSRDEIQARLFLEDCKAFAKILHCGASDMGEQFIDDEKKFSAFVLKLANGTRIHSMSSSPDAQAGKRGTRLLDEFALHKDPKKMYSIAYPGITWGGQLAIVSTHRGSQNYFNVLVREIKEKGNPKGISLHTVTLQTALEQGFLYILQKKLSKNNPIQEMDEGQYFNFIRSQCADEEQFMQEYMCIPANDNTAFFPYDVTALCEWDQYEEWERDIAEIKNPVYIGIDIGRRHDLTCAWFLEDNGTTLLTRKIITLSKTPFPEQEKILWPFFALPNVRRIRIDEGGLGMELAERAQIDFGQYKVEKVMFNPRVKEEMAYAMKNLWEARGIRIPFDPKIREDFNGVKKTVTADNNVRFSADRGPGGHSDRFWACALAVTGVNKFEGPALIEAAGYKVSNTADPFTESRARDGQKKDTLGGW